MTTRQTKTIAHAIKQIEELKTNTWRGRVMGKATSILKHSEKSGFELTIFQNGINHDDLAVGPITLATSNNQFILDGLIEGKHQTKFNKETRKAYTSRSYTILNFRKGEEQFESNCYLRSIIPISEGFNCYFIFEIKTIHNDYNGVNKSLLEVEMDNNKFYIYATDILNAGYLIIESLQPLSYNQFSQYCWTISIALAFFTGQLWQNEQYIFSYPTPDMALPTSISYEKLRPCLRSIYTPVTSNPYARIRSNKTELAESYFDKTKEVNKEVLSNLCNWVHKKDEHKIVILLIVEAKNSSLLMMPAGFAIALEALATLFEEWFPEAIVPIKNKAKARQIADQMKATLVPYQDDPDVNTFVIEKKLNAINSPTNRDRLKIPFEILNIPLTKEDDKALMYRNALLHGNVSLIPYDRQTFEMKELELGMRLMTLANAIILKLMSYDGYIINHVRTPESVEDDTSSEAHFRAIGPQIILW
ncbi:hypothetical protein [[Flexibacter] sp. ATCC 35208]|uniref:hypothetical protein n=1 Tax=[Flexibacter] sp. ATCC 35208 TaxID=1936242 RepID=UPI0009D4DB0B|nr:hypothetical protein [[Flexibacter] sp. ATCC 35208]OMP75796.1 hypothetical protein BW716_28215 [[Flexibacter] sp. ATCC 35208]